VHKIVDPEGVVELGASTGSGHEFISQSKNELERTQRKSEKWGGGVERDCENAGDEKKIAD